MSQCTRRPEGNAFSIEADRRLEPTEVHALDRFRHVVLNDAPEALVGDADDAGGGGNRHLAHHNERGLLEQQRKAAVLNVRPDCIPQAGSPSACYRQAKTGKPTRAVITARIIQTQAFIRIPIPPFSTSMIKYN